jgi:hypothetical protein
LETFGRSCNFRASLASRRVWLLLDHSRGLRGVFETADDGLVTVQIGLYGFRHGLRARGENQASRQDWTLTDELPEPGKHCYPPLCTTSDWVHIFLTKKSSISVLHPQRALRVEPQGEQALRSAFFQSAALTRLVPQAYPSTICSGPFELNLRASRPFDSSTGLRAGPRGAGVARLR